MQQIQCTYIKRKENYILVMTDKVVLCPGLSMDIIAGTPLVLTGEYITETQFKIAFLKLDTSNTEALIKLLVRRNFKQVGEATAKRIIQKCEYKAADKNLPNFSVLTYEDYKEVLETLNLPNDTVEKIAIYFSGLNARAGIYQALLTYGGTFADADMLYQRFHTAVVDEIIKDPYQGIECGLSLSLCDKIASANHKEALSKERLKAIGRVFTDKLEQQGSCCLTVENAVAQLGYIQNTGSFEKISGWTILLYLTNTKQLVLEDDAQYGTLVYPLKLLSIEQQITYELNRLNSSPVNIGFTEYSGGWNPDPDQLRAIGLVSTTGVKIVTGGPGTGKTSVIKEMIREYKHHADSPNIFLCAPTGAAAARINFSLDNRYHARTIHKLLDVRRMQDDSHIYMFNKKHPLPKGLFIVDEMSMVGEEIFLHLLQAIPSGSILIMTGDIDQLQSVSSGTVLKDLIEAGIFETVRLNTIHRQDGPNMIVQNYYHIKNNDKILENGDGFYVYEAKTRQDRLKVVAGLYKYLHRNCQILTLTRQGYLGKNHIDELITQAMSDKTHQYKHMPFYLSDHIMMLSNNYDHGYFNGDVGVITQVLSDSVMVQFADGLLELHDDDLWHAEHAWSCTVHKAQGSEYDNVIIVLDDEYPQMLYKSILLTAVTRARKNVHIVTTKDALNSALSADNEQLRITGLAHMLKRSNVDVL